MRHVTLLLLSVLVNFSVLGQNSKRVLFPFNFYDSWGFVDSQGKIIIEPKFEEAFNFHDGLAKVRLNGYFGFIDPTGKLVIPNKFESAEHFHNGVAIAKNGGFSFYINKKGETLFGGYLVLHDFQKDGYATVLTRTGEFLIVNKKGDIIKEGENFIYDLLSDKKTYVYLDKYGDVKEQYESKFEDIDYNQIQEFGDYLVYSEGDKYGIANFKKGFVTNTWYDGINTETLTDDLIQLKNNDNLCYINQQGKTVFIDKQVLELNRFLSSGKTSTEAILRQFNISYMREADYEVGSIGNMPVLRSHGGWQPSKNVFKKITSVYNFKPNTLDIIVDDERNEIFEEVYEGYKFYITNNTKDSIFFEAYKSKIDVMLEAKNSYGDWEEIEDQIKDWEPEIPKDKLYLKDKRGFHQLYLLSKTYWELTIPKYYGALKTKLRLKLTYKDSPDGEAKTIYSNEFNGGVNPAQFWLLKSLDYDSMKPNLRN